MIKKTANIKIYLNYFLLPKEVLHLLVKDIINY